MGALWVRGGRESVEFVGWRIIGLVVKSQNDWRDVGGRPPVAMHRNLNLF